MKSSKESFSQGALKRIKRMSKDELVEMVLKLNNYGEDQKAMNIILLKMVTDLQSQVPQPKEEDKIV